jgi:hypothetical protein
MVLEFKYFFQGHKFKFLNVVIFSCNEIFSQYLKNKNNSKLRKFEKDLILLKLKECFSFLNNFIQMTSNDCFCFESCKRKCFKFWKICFKLNLL